MSSRPRESWVEKLHDETRQPKLEPIEGRLLARWGRGTMLVPAPLEVDELMRRVRKGRITTIDAIRGALARRHEATFTCPITTGIFTLMAARAADEERAAGKSRITPYWRGLRSGGELNPEYPGGIEGQLARLVDEGREISVRGKRAFVVGHESKLAALDP